MSSLPAPFATVNSHEGEWREGDSGVQLKNKQPKHKKTNSIEFLLLNLAGNINSPVCTFRKCVSVS